VPTLLIAGCQPDLSRQPKVPKPDSASEFFIDGRADRPIEPGTVARGQLRADAARFTGKLNDQYVVEFPVPVNVAIIERGRERFDIYCTHCHDRLGTGNGKVVQRGLIKPPSFQSDDSRGLALRGQKVKLTEVPVGYIFDVITNGLGAMADHAAQVPADDRWAIVAYIRVLQETQGGARGQ
jgi:cytochrome c